MRPKKIVPFLLGSPKEEEVGLYDDLQEQLSEINEQTEETAPKLVEEQQPAPFSKGEEKTQDQIQKQVPNFGQIEKVMTKGMEFLTGMYAMSSGKSIESTAKPKVNVNKETGEVSITFKMDF